MISSQIYSEPDMYLEPQNQVSCGKCYNGDINGNRRDTEEIHSERWQLWQISGRETGWSGVVKDRSDWFQEMEMKVKIFQKRGTVRSRVEQKIFQKRGTVRSKVEHKSFTEIVLSKTKDLFVVSRGAQWTA